MRYVSIVICTLIWAANGASAAVLQIDDNGTPGEWDYLEATQTGSVDGTRLEVTSTAEEWESNGFTDESASYANSALYGTLAQPAGTIGDLFNQQIFSRTQTFSWTLEFLDPISDPIFYFGDVDFVGATLTVPSGYASYDGNSDFSKSGDVFTVTSGAREDTPGAFIAVFYNMDFSAGDTLVFLWDYSGVALPGGENIGFGIATNPVVSPPGPSPVPLPASGMLLLGALAFLATRRKTAGATRG